MSMCIYTVYVYTYICMNKCITQVLLHSSSTFDSKHFHCVINDPSPPPPPGYGAHSTVQVVHQAAPKSFESFGNFAFAGH